MMQGKFKIILWDFDGVIFDSMKIKEKGFRKLFNEFDEKLIDTFIKFHHQNGGMPRFEKIKYFYEELLKQNITQNKINQLANKYGEIIQKELFNKNNLIEDSFNFIKQNYKKYNFHIVSGAEHNELNQLCKFLEIDKYFITIEGSPTLKKDLIKNLLQKYDYQKKEVCLIGDSINDCKAAEFNGIKFYAYNNENLKQFDYIKDFNEFFSDK